MEGKEGESFKEFMVGKEIVDTEKEIETEWFIGRYDIRLKVMQKQYLCDFKSKSRIYLEDILQLTAYRMATKDTDVALIEIPQFKFKPLGLRDFTPYEEILKALSTIFKNKALVD